MTEWLTKLRDWTQTAWQRIKPAAIRTLGLCAAVGILAGLIYIDKKILNLVDYRPLTGAEVLAGIISIIGLSLLTWRSHLLHKQVTIQIAKEIDDRFNAAVQLLASAQTSARTGGIYSLYHLAMSQEKYRTESFQILCSHIRSKTQEKEYQKDHPNRPSNEIQTAINLLFKNKNGLDGLYPAHHANLPAADLSHAYLVGADFICAFCQQANFSNANSQKAKFWRANCQKARFWEVNCQQASFIGAQCQQTNFMGAVCQQTNFLNAYCQKANFALANCQQANFTDANCQQASFWNASCQQTNFLNANCQQAHFGHAKNTDTVIFHGANIEGAEFDNGKKPSTKSPTQ